MNWWIFGIAVLFWIEETAYFGWNWKPQSPAEVICDGIVLLITALAILNRDY